MTDTVVRDPVIHPHTRSMANPDDLTLNERAARQHANTSKTPPQWAGNTPRWLVQLLPWTPVEAGVYRINRVLDEKFAVDCTPDDNEPLPIARINYAEQPREYQLTTVSTTI